MARQLHIFVGGVGNNDYSTLIKFAGTPKEFSWSSIKDAKPGDRVLIYIVAPHSRLIAKAEVLSFPVKGETGDFAYRADIGKVKLLKNQITLDQMRKAFPKWSWLIQPRSKARVPDENQQKLWKMVNAVSLDGPIEVIGRGGAGFGNAKTNRLVEKAAIRKVTKALIDQGYTVISREKENLGYDLDASNATALLHVEVKGISGNEIQFPITANELNQSKNDPNFQLFAVTLAGTRNAVIHQFSGALLQKKFKFRPISFIAESKA